MKIECTCGYVIVDQTDYLSNKAFIISDTQWFDFWESIDDAIKKSGPTPKGKEDAVMQVRGQSLFKLAWECKNCGKLYIDGKDGSLLTYTPDSKGYNEALNKKQ